MPKMWNLGCDSESAACTACAKAVAMTSKAEKPGLTAEIFGFASSVLALMSRRSTFFLFPHAAHDRGSHKTGRSAL